MSMKISRTISEIERTNKKGSELMPGVKLKTMASEPSKEVK